MRTGASRLSGVPIISLDLCYTKAGEIDRHPQPRDRGQPEEEMVIDLYEEDERKEAEELRIRELKSALWLIMVDSQTPLKSKGQLSLMAREIMTFAQSLGHVEVGLYADNEPTMRSLLRIVLNSRRSMGLRTRLYTTYVLRNCCIILVSFAARCRQRVFCLCVRLNFWSAQEYVHTQLVISFSFFKYGSCRQRLSNKSNKCFWLTRPTSFESFIRH